MKPLNSSRIKLTHPRVLSLFALASLMFSLTLFSQVGQAQQAQLSLADILIGLRSKKVTLEERNKLLAGAVIERGVTFSLTPEIETELVGTGASLELVGAIRAKSEKIKVAAISKPISAPAPVSTPVPLSAATPAPTLDYAFYRQRADENNSKGEYELAVGDYNKAIELNPADAAAYLNRGRANSGRKSYDLAILDYDKTIELAPKDSNAYLARGEVYEKKGNRQQAVSDYQKAVELDASSEPAKNNLKRLRDEQAKTLPKAQEAPSVAPPKMTETTPAAPKTLELGQLNSFALKLVMPTYPEIAQKLNAHGKVTVQVTIDEEGKVISAKATSGSALLRSPSEDAARKSKFRPALVGTQPVKATGFITYNFVERQ